MKPAPIFVVIALLASQSRAEDAEIPVSCRSPEATAQVKRARLLLDNIRVAEAQATLQKAVELDPDCATAQATLSTVLPGTEAGPHVAAALAHLEGLPVAERTQIELFAAFYNGENAKARELTARLVELAPGDWRAHNGLGGQALGDQDYDKAIAEFSKAIELNPQAAGAYNNLGYSYAGQERFDEAAATFRKYAAVAPQEPNAHDSLAEVLMNGGHLAEAEAEFQKALALDSKFAGAWTGIAQTRLLRGDEKGADQALAKELDVDTRPVARIGSEINVATALLAEGKPAASFKRLDQVKAKAKKLGLPQYYFIDALQARLQMREGHVEKALALANASDEVTRKAKLPAGLTRGLKQGILIEQVRANALLHRKAETAKALAEMEEVVRPAAQNAFNASQLQNSRGVAALASNDFESAVAAMRKCQHADFQCLYELERAQEAAGDTAGAAASRDRFLKVPRRGIEYVYLWKKLGGKPAARVAGAPDDSSR